MEFEPAAQRNPKRDGSTVVCAPDSFKECLSAAAVARAMALGVRDAVPSLDVIEIPMADGGEGTVEALLAAKHGEWVGATVTGPNGRPVHAEYGLIDHGRTAVIEMAAASGLALVPEPERNALTATTRGTGELIVDALERGCNHILVGLGGSATTDGGAGMASALGARLLDADGNPLPDGGAALRQLATIDASGLHPALKPCKVEAACDVRNPLCGRRGAAFVYGPQKGATARMVRDLDAALVHYADCIKDQLGFDVKDVEGGGAAGGTAVGLIVFAGAILRPGVEMVAAACGLESAIAEAALVLTGEGTMDGQSIDGKTPVGVARLAARYDVPCVAIVGRKQKGWDLAQEAAPFEEVYALAQASKDLAGNKLDPFADAAELIQVSAEWLTKQWHQAPA